MMKLSLSPYIAALPMFTYTTYSPYHASNPVPASFSTAFSANGSKFAVASQEGAVVVWDVRSTKPLKVIQTDKERSLPSSHGTSSASGWLYESSQAWEWGRGHGKAPGWGVRSVKFSPRGVGREVLTFTEVSNCAWLGNKFADCAYHSTHRYYMSWMRKRSRPRRLSGCPASIPLHLPDRSLQDLDPIHLPLGHRHYHIRNIHHHLYCNLQERCSLVALSKRRFEYRHRIAQGGGDNAYATETILATRTRRELWLFHRWGTAKSTTTFDGYSRAGARSRFQHGARRTKAV